MDSKNCYEDETRAAAYAKLEFAGTYSLAYRDLPKIFQEHIRGTRALDFGCGTGRSTRFLTQHGFKATGVDISAEMISKAKSVDPDGDYQLIPGDDFSNLPSIFDLILCAFPFDNIGSFELKVKLFRELGELLSHRGRIVNLVSSPEIYTHEWVSFSTKDFPQNRYARSGDPVKIIVMDIDDHRPVEDVFWTDESYQEVYAEAGLQQVAVYRPLAKEINKANWVNETTIAPWVIYVLAQQ